MLAAKATPRTRNRETKGSPGLHPIRRAPPALCRAQRGFIGPVGDDIPSIIPLLIGLVVFFSTFSFTFNIYNQKNAGFDADLSALRVARVLQSNGYIVSGTEFRNLCRSLSETSIRFVAGITDVVTNPAKFPDPAKLDKPGEINPYALDFIQFDEGAGVEYFFCTNIRDFQPADLADLDADFFRSKTVLLKVYPIVYEDNRIVKPVHLVVVAWNN